jgi:hypothetical protein
VRIVGSAQRFSAGVAIVRHRLVGHSWRPAHAAKVVGPGAGLRSYFEQLVGRRTICGRAKVVAPGRRELELELVWVAVFRLLKREIGRGGHERESEGR